MPKSKSKPDLAESIIAELRDISWISEWPKDREHKRAAIFFDEAYRIIRRVCREEKKLL